MPAGDLGAGLCVNAGDRIAQTEQIHAAVRHLLRIVLCVSDLSVIEIVFCFFVRKDILPRLRQSGVVRYAVALCRTELCKRRFIALHAAGSRLIAEIGVVSLIDKDSIEKNIDFLLYLLYYIHMHQRSSGRCFASSASAFKLND